MAQRRKENDSSLAMVISALQVIYHRKLMPALYSLAKEDKLPTDFYIIGLPELTGPMRRCVFIFNEHSVKPSTRKNLTRKS